MTNYDGVECESSGECHQHLMWIDGTRFDKDVLGGSNPSFEVEDDERCIRYKLDDFSAEVYGSSCNSSRKFVCQFECANPLGKCHTFLLLGIIFVISHILQKKSLDFIENFDLIANTFLWFYYQIHFKNEWNDKLFNNRLKISLYLSDVCPNGENPPADYIAGPEGLFYKFHTSDVTAWEAMEVCNQEGTTLATVKSQEQYRLFRIMQSKTHDKYLFVAK